jgi:hypothetical protein
LKLLIAGVPRDIVIRASYQASGLSALNDLTMPRSGGGLAPGVGRAGGRGPLAGLEAFVATAEEIGQAIQNLPQLGDEIADGITNFIGLVQDAVSLAPDLVEALDVLPEISVPLEQDIQEFFGAVLNLGYMVSRLPGLADEISGEIGNFVGTLGDALGLLPDLVEGLAIIDEVIVPTNLAIARFTEAIRILGNAVSKLPGLGDEISSDISNFIGTTGDALGTIPDLVEGLALIDEVIPPSTLAMARFTEAIRLIGGYVANLPGLGEDIAEDISNFLGVTGDALGLMTDLVEGLDALDGLGRISVMKVRAFADAIELVGNQFAVLPGIGTEIAEEIQAFLAVAGDALSLIPDAVEGFAVLPDIVVPMEDDVQAFTDGLVAAVDALLTSLEEAGIKIRIGLSERLQAFAEAGGALFEALLGSLDFFSRWQEALDVIRKNEERFTRVVDEFTDRFAYVVEQAIQKIQARLTLDQAELGEAIASAAGAVFQAITAGTDAMNAILEGTLPAFRDNVTAVMDGVVAAIEIINTYEGVLTQNAALAQTLVEQVMAILEPLGLLSGAGGGSKPGAPGAGGAGGGGGGAGLDLATALYRDKSTPWLQVISEQLADGIAVSGGGTGGGTAGGGGGGGGTLAGALAPGSPGGTAIASSEWGDMLQVLLGNVPEQAKTGKIGRLLEALGGAEELERLLRQLEPEPGPLAELSPWHRLLVEAAAFNQEYLASRGSGTLEFPQYTTPLEITLVMPNGDVLGRASTEWRSTEARLRGYLT